jgi:hypothetical protein
VPEEDANVYAEGLRRGGVLLTVRINSANVARAEQILDQSAVRTGERAEAYRQTGWQRFDPYAGRYTADQRRGERR